MRLPLLLLTAVPTVWAALAYSIPPSLAMKAADSTNDCTLPNDYHVISFSGATDDGGQTLSELDFRFWDDTTMINTTCHWNTTSQRAPGGNATPRYSCTNTKIEFIWEQEDRDLWMIQKVCPGPEDGVADWEVSGSVHININCADTGACTSNQTDYKALFTSLAPIRNPPSNTADQV